MTDIIDQLKGLTVYCKKMIDEDDPDCVWKDDVVALSEAAKKLEDEYGGENAAEIIRRIMEKENVSQKELAMRMQCTRQNINQILTNRTANMRYDLFYRMTCALGYEIIVRKK